MFDSWRGFTEQQLGDEWHRKLTDMAREARGNILKMTTVAGSGHPGGSMSSIEIFLTLYNMANVDPRQPRRDDRDRIIISHGHTSPGVYSALAAAGFFDIYPALHGFRQGGSPFEGMMDPTISKKQKLCWDQLVGMILTMTAYLIKMEFPFLSPFTMSLRKRNFLMPCFS